MSDPADVVERLKNGETGKPIDRDIARLLGWHRVEPRHTTTKHGAWIAPEDFAGQYSNGSPKLDGLHGTTMHRDVPNYTTSMTVCLELHDSLFPEYGFKIVRLANVKAAYVYIGKEALAFSETPAAAWIAALLKLYFKIAESDQ